MKLIDADKLKMSFKPYFDGKKTIGQIIDEQPTVEAQSNRCESCTHSEEQDGLNCYECVKGMADNFEAQPTDAVWRSDVEYIIKGSLCDLRRNEDKRIFINTLNSLPSVTQQPKTGHWIDMHINTLFKGKTVKQIKYQCSVCGFEILWLDKSNKYCRNCGSIMDVYDADKGGNSDADSD